MTRVGHGGLQFRHCSQHHDVLVRLGIIAEPVRSYPGKDVHLLLICSPTCRLEYLLRQQQ